MTCEAFKDLQAPEPFVEDGTVIWNIYQDSYHHGRGRN